MLFAVSPAASGQEVGKTISGEVSAGKPRQPAIANKPWTGDFDKLVKRRMIRGLDPDKWFNNVELVVAERIGQETTTYVRNIYKYYVAYKLTLAAQEVQRRAREQVAPSAAQ